MPCRGKKFEILKKIILNVSRLVTAKLLNAHARAPLRIDAVHLFVCLSVCLFVCRHITFFTPRSLHFLEICLDATAVLHSHSHSSKAFNLINWKKKKKYKSMHYKVAAVLPLSNCRLYSDIVQYLSPPKTAKTTRASSPRYRMDERKCG